MEFLDADALRLQAGHAMAQFHQRFDLVLCPTVPNPPMFADDAPTVDLMQALWAQWTPWTFAFNLTCQSAITVPMGVGQIIFRVLCKSRRRNFATI